MVEPEDREVPADWSEFVVRARERIAEQKAQRERDGGAPSPGPEAGFLERYDHLVAELSDLLAAIPELEIEPHGPSGLRIGFPPTHREVRVTALEEQGFVHFVFGHATLGTLHRAEHHATRPFGDARPDVPRLARQVLAFLIEGVEPRWLTHRPAEPPTAREPGPDETLELPLD